MSETAQALGGPPRLRRAIRRWDLVALNVNLIVGAGIFGLPSRVFALAGPATLLAYAVCAIAVLAIVLCFAEVGSRFDRAGGPYLYAHQAFGPLVAFEVGWLRWCAAVLAFAANANLLAGYLGFVWPAAESGVGRVLVIAVTVLALMTINVRGVRGGALVSNVLAAGKLVPLLLFVLVGSFFVEPSRLALAAPASLDVLSASSLVLLYAFVGFESRGIPAGETREPQRSLPFALIITLALVTVLYVSIQIVCAGTLPDLADSTRPLADASRAFLGPAGGLLLVAGAMVSITGNLNGQMLVTPRLVFAMAENRQLPGFLATVHERFRTPHWAIVSTSAVALVLAFSSTFLGLATLSVMARLVVFAVTCAALPVFRRRGSVAAPAFRVPAGNLVAAIAVLLCAWLLASSSRHDALVGAGAAAAGLLFFALGKRAAT